MVTHRSGGSIGAGYSGLPAAIKRALRHPLISPAEEYDLLLKAKAGDRGARDRLTLSNLRLALKSTRNLYGLDLEDRLQLGFLGLNRSIDLYRPETHHRFSTVAYWGIKAEIQEYFRQNDVGEACSLDAIETEIPDQSASPWAFVEACCLPKQLRRQVWLAVRHLSRVDRKVIYLRLQGKRFREIGKRLNLATSSCSFKYHKNLGLLHEVASSLIHT